MDRADRAELFQQPQGLDLRRLQRDPAQHHHQGGAGAVRGKQYAGVIPRRSLRDTNEYVNFGSERTSPESITTIVSMDSGPAPLRSAIADPKAHPGMTDF